MKKMTKALRLGMTSLLLLSLLAGCSSTASTDSTTTAPSNSTDNTSTTPSTSTSEPVEIRIAHSDAETNPIHIGFLKFQEVIEASGTNITVKIFPNSQLTSSDRDIIEGIQLGEIDMGSVSSGNLASTLPEFYVFSASYLFDSIEDARDTLMGEKGDYLKDSVAEGTSGIKIAGFYGGTMQSIWTTNKPINSFEDMSNMKIRAEENAIFVATVQGLGATPTTVNFSELYTSLQQGTIDGLFSNRVTALQMFKDVLATGTYLGHSIFLPVVIASDSLYNSLSPEQQAAFDEAMIAACEAQWQAVLDLDEECLAELAELTASGDLVYVTELSAEDQEKVRDAFISSSEDMVAELCGAEILEYFRS